MLHMATGVGLRAILSSHVTGVRISSVHQWRFVLLCCVGCQCVGGGGCRAGVRLRVIIASVVKHGSAPYL
jgi:hypothetical protein